VAMKLSSSFQTHNDSYASERRLVREWWTDRIRR